VPEQNFITVTQILKALALSNRASTITQYTFKILTL